MGTIFPTRRYLRMRTIVALATGIQRSAIAIVRLSGDEAHRIALSMRAANGSDAPVPSARCATLCRLYDGAQFLDEALVTLFEAPRSYTGEDMAEIACHASPYIVRRIIDCCLAAGATLAEPGEFTQRAYLNGKLDLAQAEAVDDLIRSTTTAQHRAATGQLLGCVSTEVKALRDELLHLVSLLELEIDFGEEDVEFANRDYLTELAQTTQRRVRRLIKSYGAGEAIRRGIDVAIVGPPNAGKSTLLNHLLAEERAIVSDIPGTPRDVVEGERLLHGLQFRFADTAGLRATDDPVESIGVARARARAQEARVILLVMEAQQALEHPRQLAALAHDVPACAASRIVVLSKIDRLEPAQLPTLEAACREQCPGLPVIPWSAIDKQGAPDIEAALTQVAESILGDEEDVVVTNQRHHAALLQADQELELLMQALRDGLSQDLTAFHCRAVVQHLGSITGEIGVEDILGNIFSHFCIGK